ncbi:peroxin, partial [Entomortierella chlamydospora]
MKRRFEQNQQDCVFTVLSLLPTLGDQLLHELHVELITAKLNQGRSQRSTPVPTPDGSVILTPKPAETPVFATASVATENGEEGEIKKNKEGEDGSEKKDEQELTIENHTTQESEDKPEANGTSEEHKTNGVLENGDSKSESETEKEKEENSQEGSVVNGSAPEIKVEQESAEPQTTNNAEETAAEVQKATQAAVKDEVAAAIDRRTKLELWSELKIMTFTRTITALYSLTFLTLLTQIQLNLLGRFTYVSSVIALSNTTDASYRVESPAVKGSLTSTNGLLDFQTEKKYLTFSYWLLHEGWRRWSEKVREVIEEVVGGISLKRSLNAKEFSDLLREIRTRLEYTEVDGKR